MKVIESYIAFDGKEFTDKDLCAKYEFEQKLELNEYSKYITFYNEERKELPLHDLAAIEDETCCIIIKDVDKFTELFNLYEDYCEEIEESNPFDYLYSFADKCGVYAYSRESDRWGNLNYEIDKLQGQLNYWMEGVG